MKNTLFLSFIACMAVTSLFAEDPAGAEYSQSGCIAIDGVYHYAEAGYCNPLDPTSSWNGLTSWITDNINVDAFHRLEADVWKAALHHSLVFDEHDELAYALYEAYILLYPLDGLSVSLGRQRLNFGTSLVFSPMDTINPAEGDAAEPGGAGQAKQYIERFAAKLKGFDGLSLTLTPLPDLSISAAVSLDQALQHQTSSWAEDLRLALVVSGLYGELAFFASTVYQFEETCRMGGGFSYDLFGFIIYAEAGIELNNQLNYPFASGSSMGVGFHDKPLWQAAPLVSAGLQRLIMTDDYTVTILAEYLFSGDGYTKGESDLLYRAVAYIITTPSPANYAMLAGLNLPELIGMHHLFIALGFDLTDKFYTEHTVLLNLDDWSFNATHSLCLTFVPQIDFQVTVIWMYGEKGKSEFGLSPEQFQLTLGAKLHF